ncbi:MAG TPA: S1C family serine protease [Caulobacteraceae bacterium]|jgi:S1-C subfamily serine protease|nr:S1C family serine protease [Caulobacteraceae bacterium]
MAEAFEEWSVAQQLQPKAEDFPFDLDWTLSSTVALRALVPPDAFTAQILGTLRIGHGAVIGQDLVATIGYLVTEAEQVWLQTGAGKVVAAHPLGVDMATGFGLVKALGPLDVPALEIGDSRQVLVGDKVIVGGGGRVSRSVAARLVGREEFAGYWEYVLDEALFTAPSHPMWSGAPVIGPTGKLVGIGSLQMQQQLPGGKVAPLNMSVPIDLLPPILPALMAGGHDLPRRPWLGLLSEEISGRVVIVGATKNGPADRADLGEGDIVLAVAGEEVTSLAEFYHAVWALGPPGVTVPLTLAREGDVFQVEVKSKDRASFLKKPRMH